MLLTASSAGAQGVDYTTGGYLVADATVQEGDPWGPQGSAETLAVRRDDSVNQRSYLKFVLPVTSRPIEIAQLNLFGVAPDASFGNTVVDVHVADSSSWSDDTLVWSNQPEVPGPYLDTWQTSGAGYSTYSADASGSSGP